MFSSYWTVHYLSILLVQILGCCCSISPMHFSSLSISLPKKKRKIQVFMNAFSRQKFQTVQNYSKHSSLPSFPPQFSLPFPELFSTVWNLFFQASFCAFTYIHMYVIWNRHSYANLHKHMYCSVIYFFHLTICLIGDYMIIYKFLPQSF